MMSFLTTATTHDHITELQKSLPQALVLYGQTHATLLPVARTIARHHSSHIFEIAPSEGRQAIAISQVREIISQTAQPSVSTQPRVYIFTTALSHDAHHAMLKLLEDAPEHCHFIITTVSLHLLPPTIISRCQRLHLAPPTPHDIEQAAREKGILDESTLKQLLFISDIMPGELTRLIDQPERIRDIAERIVEAKKFVTSPRRDRFSIIKHHQKKDDLQEFITIVAAILHRQSLAAPEILLTKEKIITRATNALAENASPKLVGSFLAWSL